MKRALIYVLLLGVVASGCRRENVETESDVVQTTEQMSTEESVQEETERETYSQHLGLGSGDDDGRIEVHTTEAPPPTTEEVVQTEPTYDTLLREWTHADMPRKDRSHYNKWTSGVGLADFSTRWGSSLTDDDFRGGSLYIVGVWQNEEDFYKGDMQSLGWLIEHLDELSDNDAVKFTDIRVVKRLSETRVAMICTYVWDSAFYITDNLIFFEDRSGNLAAQDFEHGDVFSCLVFRHNIKVEEVNGQRVVNIQYYSFN